MVWAGVLLHVWALPAFAAEPKPGMTSHAGDHDFAHPREAGVALTDVMEHVRVAWTNPTHTGFVKGDSGTALQLLNDGQDPAYGDAASPILTDGVLLVSWSQPSGEVTTDLDTINHRYYSDRGRNEKLADTYFRIDADWHTLALDAQTGKQLWHRVEPSAAMNFLSNKRDHNGISGAAGEGVYVTITMLGHVFAYDLKTGETRWTTTLEGWNKQAQSVKDDMLANRRLPHLNTRPFGHKRSGAIIVDGLAILPDMRGGLVGVKLSDGGAVWQTANCLHDQATPRPWRHKGKTWLVGHHANKGGSGVHLIDPATGAIQWTHKTGFNPGQVLMGDGHILLNADPKATAEAVLTCYAITPAGLEERWAFENVVANIVQVKADSGAIRKGVIRDGIVYLKLGAGQAGQARIASVDLATGKELAASAEPASVSRGGQPFIAEDKFYLHTDPSHSGNNAGLWVYQLGEAGRIAYLGEVRFQGFGIQQVTEYEHPIEMPYAGGKLYMRGRTEIVAIDLAKPSEPMGEVALDGLWAGFARPVKAVVFTRADGTIQSGRLESPPRNELGVVGTTAHRGDSWTPFTLPSDVKLGEAFEAEAEFRFVTFAWPGRVVMRAAEGDQWQGTWFRDFPGWEQTLTFTGNLDAGSKGGYARRGWPTTWLKDQPISFFSDLPDGQRRVILQLHEFTPPIPSGKGPQGMTLCLDHDGKKVAAAIGGAFGFNQSYHELDGSELVVTEKGITGSALIILNPDPWVPGDHQNGGSLAGRINLDVTFEESDAEGIHAVGGEWSVEWGLKTTRSGAIRVTVKKE